MSKLIDTLAPVIEEMESKHPEKVIAAAVVGTLTDPALGEDRLVRIGDVIDALEGTQGTVMGPYTARIYLRRKFVEEG